MVVNVSQRSPNVVKVVKTVSGTRRCLQVRGPDNGGSSVVSKA